MDFRILGPLEVKDGPRTVPLPQGRQRLLLAVLLLHRNKVVSRDRLIDALWGETPPATAQGSLHNVVSALRKGFGDGRLATRNGGYLLRVEPGELDADRFEELVGQGAAAQSNGDRERAAALLREALDQFRGPPLGDLAYHPALADEAARLEEAGLVALEERIEADLARGRHGDVVAELEGLVAQHPLRERLRAQQLVALYRCGRQADALATYRDARARLVDELGIEPGPGLRRVERAVLEQDPELGAPDTLPASPPVVTWARRHAGALIVAGAVALAAAVVAVVTNGGADSRSDAAVISAGDFLAAIDPATNQIVRRYPVGDTPTAVAVGAGAAWTVNGDGRSVSRVDVRSGAVTTTSAGALYPLDIAAGADAAWVAGATDSTYSVSQPARLVRLDAAGAPVDDVRLAPAHGPSTRLAPQLVAADDDAVWAIGRTGRLQRVDVTTGVAQELRGFRAERVAVGDGQVWVLAERRPDRPQAPALLRLDPRTGDVVTGIGLPSDTLGTLAVGAGATWVTDWFTGIVWRIDPARRAGPRPIPVGQGIEAIAAGDDGVWVANPLTGAVVRIDPKRNDVDERLDLGATPRGIAIAGDRVFVTGAGAGRNPAAAGSLSQDARVEPISSHDCTPVLTGSNRNPDFLVVLDDLFQGPFRARTEAVHAATAFVLRRHDFRAGRFSLGLQRCDDGLAHTGSWDEAKCKAHAQAYARNPRVIGVLGPSFSFCTAAMLPVLNAAPGGPVSLVSGTNSFVYLVRGDDPFAPSTLNELYPTGQQGYARVNPSDDYEDAAAAVLARRLSPRGVYLVHDEFAVHPLFFGRAARRIGLPIVGRTYVRDGAVAVDRLARQIRASGARAVWVATGMLGYLKRLRPTLGPDIAMIVGTGGGYSVSTVVDLIGPDAARGLYVTVPGQPVERLGPAGRQFLRDFSATRPGRVPNSAVSGAAAASALLDAIARSDGTRKSVARNLATVELPDSPVGPLSFQRSGEPTANPIAIVRADHGGEPNDGVLTAGGDVVDVITPAARLVGRRPAN